MQVNLTEVTKRLWKDLDEDLKASYLSGFYTTPDADEVRRLRAMGVQV